MICPIGNSASNDAYLYHTEMRQYLYAVPKRAVYEILMLCPDTGHAPRQVRKRLALAVQTNLWHNKKMIIDLVQSRMEACKW